MPWRTRPLCIALENVYGVLAAAVREEANPLLS